MGGALLCAVAQEPHAPPSPSAQRGARRRRLLGSARPAAAGTLSSTPALATAASRASRFSLALALSQHSAARRQRALEDEGQALNKIRKSEWEGRVLGLAARPRSNYHRPTVDPLQMESLTRRSKTPYAPRPTQIFGAFYKNKSMAPGTVKCA
jgi:hypothetical protein